MTPEQIETWDTLATAYAESNARTSEEWSMAWRTQFARLARADAFETAANVCLLHDEKHMAEAIRAEAAKEAK
jgi:hypothetical protein